MSAPTDAAQFARVALIVNTRARRGREQVARARRLLAMWGVPLAVSYAPRGSARLPATVRAALDADCDLIILGGATAR